MKDINAIDLEKDYVDKDKAMLMLGVESHNFYKVASEFGVKIITQGKVKHFCLEDLLNSKNEVDKFIDKHYACKYVEQNMLSARKCERYGLERLKPPKHYNGLILKYYNHNPGSKFFRKDEVDKIVALNDGKGDTSILDRYTKSEDDVYLSKKDTIELLGTTEEFLADVVSKFNIRTNKKGESLLLTYNLRDLKAVLRRSDKFHDKYYSSAHVCVLISQDLLDKHNIQHTNIPIEIKYIQMTKYDTVNPSMKYYPKEDINNIVEKLDKYVDSKTLSKMLEKPSLKHLDVELFTSEFGIKTIHKKKGVYKFHLGDVSKAIEELKSFFESHYFASDVTKMVDTSILDKNNIKRYPVPKHYVGLLEKSYDTKSKTTVVKKSEVDKILEERELSIKQKERQKKSDEELQSKINNGELITAKEACVILSISMDSLTKLRKLEIIPYTTNSFGVAGGIYYNTKDVDLLLKKRNSFFEKYVPLGNPCNKYFNGVDFEYEYVRRAIKKDLKDYITEVPKYCLGLTNLYGASYINNSAVKIDALKDYICDVDAKVKAKKEAELNRSLIGSTNFETFVLRLTNSKDWEDFKPNSQYTKEKMFEYIQNYFDNSRMKDENVSSNITIYMNVAFAIKDMLDRHNVEEIYLLSSAQINLYIKTITSVTTQDILYRFLSSVNYDLMKLGLTSKLKFDFSKIKKPSLNRKPIRNADKEIYDFEVYSDVFKYLVDIKKHLPIIIEELEKTGTVVHASIWLYAMLHLNNAWRNGDCNRFPELDIKTTIQDFGIDSIEWFMENELTLPQAKAIIFKVRQWEMRISKTTMKGAFFCSDELAPAFSTAVIILTLFKQKQKTTFASVIDPENDLIMDFDSEYNNVTKAMLKTFFEQAQIKDFVFKSRKFNRSVMTYIYYLANLRGDAKALTFIKELRSHVEEENSLFYIEFNMEKIESMTKQLFQRGEFGYIPALLSQKLLSNDGDGSFEEATKKILQVNAVFEDVNKINNTSRFLNVVRHERQTVIDMISEKSFEECQEYLTNIFTCNLPNKDGSDIQCLFGSNNCQRPDLSTESDEKVSCFDCCYHIPSIYALSRLCTSIIECYKEYFCIPKHIKTREMKDFLFANQNNNIKKSKKSKLQLGLQIFRRKTLLQEALAKFGREYLFACLDLDREDFIFITDFMSIDFYQQFPELSPNKK